MRVSWANKLFLVLAFALFSPPPVGTAVAGEQTKECKAVQNSAAITLSDKLVFTMASDSAKQFCNFFVSLPPPNAGRNSVDAWYNKASLDDPKSVVESISDIAIAPIPESESETRKAVQLRIEENGGLITNCATSLRFKKGPFDGRSKDGLLSCAVPQSNEVLLLTVAVGGTFLTRVSLPRPI
jgi:hypothetical protein